MKLKLTDTLGKQDSSVSTVTGSWVRRSEVRLQATARDVPLLQGAQTGSEAHQTSYLMGTEVPFPRGKATAA